MYVNIFPDTDFPSTGILTKERQLFTVNEILDMAIRIEKNGEAVYRAAMETVSNPVLESLLEWMADEEVKHARWFKDLKQSLASQSMNPFGKEMGHDFFEGFMGDQSFSLKAVDFSRVDRIEELIDIFIEFEEDSILFYEMLQPFLQDEDTLESLNRIIEEEKRHIEQLREFVEDKTPITGVNR